MIGIVVDSGVRIESVEGLKRSLETKGYEVEWYRTLDIHRKSPISIVIQLNAETGGLRVWSKKLNQHVDIPNEKESALYSLLDRWGCPGKSGLEETEKR